MRRIAVLLYLIMSGIAHAQAISGAPAPAVNQIYLVGSAGVTANAAVKLDSTGLAVVNTTTSDTQALGISQGTATSGGYVVVHLLDQFACTFDGATTVGHIATLSTGTAGDCTDSGVVVGGSLAVGKAKVGIIQQAIGSAGTAKVQLLGPGQQGGGSGGSIASTTSVLKGDGAGNAIAAKPLAGSGAGITTGPTSTVNPSDFVQFDGTLTGGIQDSGIALNSLIQGGSLTTKHVVIGGSTGQVVVTDATCAIPTAGNETCTTFNGVPLTATGSASNFLNAAGAYTAPSGAPGGSNQQIQYNNSGVFGGTSGGITNGTHWALGAGAIIDPASGTYPSSDPINGVPIVNVNETNTNAGINGLLSNVTMTPTSDVIAGFINYGLAGTITVNLDGQSNSVGIAGAMTKAVSAGNTQPLDYLCGSCAYIDAVGNAPIDIVFGAFGEADIHGSGNVTQAEGVQGNTTNFGTANITQEMDGFYTNPANESTGTIPLMRGIVVLPEEDGTGTITEVRGVDSQFSQFAAATTPKVSDFYAESPGAQGGEAGTITDQYGLYIEEQGSAGGVTVTNPFQIYSAGISPTYFHSATFQLDNITGHGTAGVVHASNTGVLSQSLVSLTADVTGVLAAANIAAALSSTTSVNGTTIPASATLAIAAVSNAITSATGGTGTGTVTCVTASCTNLRGSYTVAGGTFTTGNLLVLVWPTTTTAYVCQTTVVNDATGASIGYHSVATATGMNITSLTSALGLQVDIDYSCKP